MADALLGGIIINEFLADPNTSPGVGFDTDGNGFARGKDEFIELYNSSGAAIDISGLELWDKGRGNWFTFPPGSVLQSGGHAMVIVNVQSGGSLPTGAPGDLFFDANYNRNVINNTGDNIVVYDPSNDEYIAATFNGDALDDPPNDYSGFSSSASMVGLSEDFGSDIDAFSIQRGPDGSGVFINTATPTPGTTNVCFTKGTTFTTSNGVKPIEALRPGDMLITKDHGAQPIRWVWARTQTSGAIKNNPALNAIRFSKGSLGDGLPHKALMMSKHHRVLLSSKAAQRMYGATDLLIPAKDLLGIDGVDLAPLGQSITYYHILMDTHEIIFADGVAAESLFVGTEVLKSLPQETLDELSLIFGSDWPDFVKNTKPARTFAKGKKARNLVRRITKNQMAMQ